MEGVYGETVWFPRRGDSGSRATDGERGCSARGADKPLLGGAGDDESYLLRQ